MFTYSIKWAREIRKFHVPVVHERLRNVQKRDARAYLWFLTLTYCYFAVLVAVAVAAFVLLKLSIAVIHKFCYNGNMAAFRFIIRGMPLSTVSTLTPHHPYVLCSTGHHNER